MGAGGPDSGTDAAKDDYASGYKMIFFVQPKILTVGLNGKGRVLSDLPLCVLSCESGAEAAALLKEERVNSVVAAWNLGDMPDGIFLVKLRAVKPDIKTIVFITAGDTVQEIKARSIGVSVVLTDKTSDELFRRAVIETNKLPDNFQIQNNSSVKRKTGFAF
jgi:response regulator RpfG family c-di-GMP phosphodiesterase